MADLTQIERDFLEKILNFITDSIITQYDAICADDAPFAYKSLGTYACTDLVASYVRNLSEYYMKLPVKALDFSIELLNETAECGDIMTCEFDFFDDLVDRYPVLNIDLDIFGIADTIPVDFIF